MRGGEGWEGGKEKVDVGIEMKVDIDARYPT